LRAPGFGSPTRSDVDWANAYLKTKYGNILRRLASGQPPRDGDERRVAALFQGESASAYYAAADNMRVQQGLRERFRESILRARYYHPTMSRVFRAAGLPPELALLPNIE